jgi:hypothetical protein
LRCERLELGRAPVRPPSLNLLVALPALQLDDDAPVLERAWQPTDVAQRERAPTSRRRAATGRLARSHADHLAVTAVAAIQDAEQLGIAAGEVVGLVGEHGRPGCLDRR